MEQKELKVFLLLYDIKINKYSLVFMYMMDSMTDDELDGKVEFTPSRILRIARGSGQSPEFVHVVLYLSLSFLSL